MITIMAIFMAILIILFGLLWYYLNRFKSYVYSLGIPVLSGLPTLRVQSFTSLKKGN